MAFNVVSRPLSLGKLAPTAGTPIRLTANLVGALVDPYLPYGNKNSSDDAWVNKIEIKSVSTNSGNLYIGIAGMVKATLVNVIRVIEPGESWPLANPVGMNTYHLGELFIDVDTTNDYGMGSCDVV
jgi:hypothetical protein